MLTILGRARSGPRWLASSVLMVASLVTVCALDAAKFPLIDRSFKVRSVIKPVFSFSRLLRVTEGYSHEQKRARIQYYSLNGEDGLRTFYYDHNGPVGIQYKMDSSTEDTCKRMTVEEFDQEFYTTFAALGVFMHTLTSGNGSQDGHIVGPSKLLLMIANKSSQMRRVSADSTRVIFAGAQELIQYELDMAPESNEDKQTISVYYDAASLSQLGASPETQLPKLISIPFCRVVIGYSSFELHAGDESQTEPMDSKKIEPNHFAFPTSDKCSGQLASSDVFSLYHLFEFKASFKASSEDATGTEEEHSVEFDGLRRVLRVDKYNRAKGRSTSDIFDFRMDRRYMVWNEKTSEEGRCIMVKNTGHQRANIQMADLLVGGAKFSLLGQAKVRGINALVYSVQALNLPYWYDKPVVYSRDGIDWLRQRGDTVYNIERSYITGFYTLVYVSDAVEDGVKLLAMEVMQANSIHLLTVHFYDFVWQLSEPDNGRLFTPIEACSAGARDDNYIGVSILLQEHSSLQAAPSSSVVQMVPQAQQHKWIDDWLSRDAALLASISDSLELDVTMIHDFESTLSRTDSRCKIDLNFRLSERPLWLHELKYVGGASMRPARSYTGSSNVLVREEVQTLRDCMDLVVPSDNLTYVYYSESESACVIDPSLMGATEDKLQHFNLLTPRGQPSVGELYQVITGQDSVNFVARMLRDGFVQRLEDRLLVLTHSQADPAMPIDPNTFNMRIKRIKLHNVNYHRRAPSGSLKRGARSGYALVAKPGTSYRVESAAAADERPKQLVDCQTACTSDFHCESFSFCIRFPETECTLSSLPYSLIESEIDKRNTKAETTGESAPFNLRKDPHCELHQNDYLQYFAGRAAFLQPFVMDTYSIEPANNSEECARTCAQATIRELQQQAQVQHTLHGHSEGELEQQAESIDQFKGSIGRLCQRFHYIEAPNEKVNREALRYYLSPDRKHLAGLKHEGGFCCFDDSRQSQVPTKGKENSPYRFVTYRADLFELDFSKFYRREHGFSLAKSEVTKEEQDAVISYALAEQMIPLLGRFDSQGDNLQYTTYADDRSCARMCFLQYAGLCRSFDTYWDRHTDGERVSKCNLNSQSIKRYERTGRDAQKLKVTSDADVWHYELKWDLLVRPLEGRQAGAIGRAATSIGDFAVLLVVIASLLSGLAFGLKLGQRLSPPKRELAIPIIIIKEPSTS